VLNIYVSRLSGPSFATVQKCGGENPKEKEEAKFETKE
jgi:hypothetical protein